MKFYPKENCSCAYDACTDVEWFKPLLDKWTDSILHYTKLEGGDDCSFWYGERPSISVIAAAAWQAKGCALEEFPQYKSKGEGNDTYNGRCDLFINLDGNRINFEAKFRYVGSNNYGDKITIDKMSEVFNTLDNEINDTMAHEDCVEYQGKILCFTTKLTDNDDQDVMLESITKRIGKLMASEINFSSICVFPKETFVAKKGKTKYLYDITGVIGKIEKTPNYSG